ncbi:alpha/beta-hydrolase [Auriscalpium vulgare]|uniref:Alpha/beta-hydrolase n=1 Tax=Auriscalpium vulgare TaxID=40419 RepID=A0ACB8S5E6_9AGAM|nr:alpha/beta-hydrolase [Auriscalpium vulgare]
MHARGLAAFGLVVGVACIVETKVQLPFSIDAEATQGHDAFKGLAVPGSLRNLSTDAFTTLRHPLFPSHSVRIKQSDFCDTTVKAYTGYIDFDAKHLFFYFFESRRDPEKDEVIFWTNGGPGCSSATGLFMELGPCTVANATDGTKYNPFSWNTNANIFFVDQPVGVGFSYKEHGTLVDTTEEAAKDIAAFVAIFFEHFSSFSGRPLHMAAESYGGRYIPLFSAAIYDQNAFLVANGRAPINLASAVIGNGMSDPFEITYSYYDVVCTPASLPPIFSISECVRMKKALPRCKKLAQAACIEQYDAMNCEAARSFCFTELFEGYLTKGLNPYDMTKTCGDGDCYEVQTAISEYLDRPDVREKLGVDASIGTFVRCSDAMGMAFNRAGDIEQASVAHVAALLERGIPVLIYAGTYDWICNWVGNERFTLNMQWSGQEEFGRQALREWRVDGKVAGKTRSARGLTFATVDAAGHMVPYDKPKEALAMINRWIAKEGL